MSLNEMLTRIASEPTASKSANKTPIPEGTYKAVVSKTGFTPDKKGCYLDLMIKGGPQDGRHCWINANFEKEMTVKMFMLAIGKLGIETPKTEDALKLALLSASGKECFIWIKHKTVGENTYQNVYINGLIDAFSSGPSFDSDEVIPF